MSKPFSRAFYNSPQWKAARREALRRDRYTCQECDARAVEVHHVIDLTPENINDPMIALNLDNLKSLCHNCHTKITKGDTGDLPEGYIFDDEGHVIRNEQR